jgi:hypothetical protein
MFNVHHVEFISSNVLVPTAAIYGSYRPFLISHYFQFDSLGRQTTMAPEWISIDIVIISHALGTGSWDGIFLAPWCSVFLDAGLVP